MKFKQLNESVLVEKEVSGYVQLPKDVKDQLNSKSYQNAYNLVVKESDIPQKDVKLAVVYVEYKPTKENIANALTLKGIIVGYDGKNPIKGYLQENPNKRVGVGFFSGPFNSDDFLDVVDKKARDKVLKEGYFKIVGNISSATSYPDKDANKLVEKLKGAGIAASKKESTKADGGGALSKADVVVNAYLEDMFPGVMQDKIKPFRDGVEKVAVELGLTNNNPILAFLKEYLNKHNMTRAGFISLNNVYANDIIEDRDLSSSEISGLLKSNMFENINTQDAEYIIGTYNDLLTDTYSEFNINELKALSAKKGINIQYDGDGSIISGKTKLFADAVVFKKGQIDKGVETADEIKKTLDLLNKYDQNKKAEPKPVVKPNTNAPETKKEPAIKVAGNIPKPDAGKEKIYDDLLARKGVDVPSLIAYLKNKNLVG